MELGYDRPFQKFLRPGEQLLWVGRPVQGLLLRSSDWTLIPFSLLWCGATIRVEAGTLGLRPGGRFNPCPATCILPFVAIGLYIMIGRFFYDAWQRRRTWYGITDQRALILYVGQTVCLNGVALAEDPRITLTRHADGTGTIIFHLRRIDPYWEGRAGRGGFLDFSRPNLPAFERIESPREVYHLIFTAREATRSDPGES